MIPIVDPETSTPIMPSGKLVVLGSMHIRWPEEKTAKIVFDTLRFFFFKQQVHFKRSVNIIECFSPSVQSDHSSQRYYIGLKARLVTS